MSHAGDIGVHPEVFISHFEEALAIEVRELLFRAFDHQVRVFVSGRDIRPGEDFRAAIQSAVKRSSLLVCLVTRESQSRPWVNYEIGLADSIGKPVNLVLMEGDVSRFGTHPVGDRQLTHFTTPSVARLFNEIARVTGIPLRKSAAGMAKKLVENCGHILRNEALVPRNHRLVVQGHVNERSGAALEELNTASCLLEDEYLQMFSDALEALPKGGGLLAVCGDKTWTHKPVFEYLKKNTDVCETKRVAVHRVYLEPTDGFDPHENALIERHLQWAEDPHVQFQISVVFGEDAESLRAEFGLPDGFGLVIPVGATPLAMMHYGLASNLRRARVFRDPWIVDVYKWIHGRLAAFGVAKSELEKYLEKKTTRKRYDMVDKYISLPPTRRK
jgi:hypothetical protein